MGVSRERALWLREITHSMRIERVFTRLAAAPAAIRAA